MRPTDSPSSDGQSFLHDRLRSLPISARKLFAVIVREAYHGPIHPKTKGTATPPEVLEACGLDVTDFYALLKTLEGAGLIKILSVYPFEEIQLSPEAGEAEAVAERCRTGGIPLEDAFVTLLFLR